jgi:plasmid stabilization system protein ParE
VTGFPYLVCYFDRPDHVDVVRVLHGVRDLGVVLSDIAEPEA